MEIQVVDETTGTALPRLLTDDLDLTRLPERLDDLQLAEVREIAEATLPTLPASDERTFGQALRMMLAALPRRNADDVSGELFVAAYERQLGHLNRSQVEFLMDKALQRCRWFPTIAECLEIVGEWRRDDEPARRKASAALIVSRENRERNKDWEARQWRESLQRDLTQDDLARMLPSIRELALRSGALRIDENGAVVLNAR